MKRVFTQSNPVKLFSGIKSSFEMKNGVSRVNIKSSKIDENPIFNQPIKK